MPLFFRTSLVAGLCAAASAASAASASSASSASEAMPAATGLQPQASLVLSAGYTRTSRDGEPAMPGFQWAEGAVGFERKGFGLRESELGLSATLAPGWRAAALIALEPGEGVGVEEAYVQTSTLGRGLTAKAGRFLSGIGYLNPQHAHAWDFIDNPLAYQVFLGRQLGADGAQLRWLAPTDTYLALGAELGRGRGYPAGAESRRRPDMAALTLHAGGDVGESHNWRAGASWIQARASGQELTAFDAHGEGAESIFSGRTRLWVLDGVWKWAPQGNATRTSFKLQGEYLRSVRSGTLTREPEGANVDGALRLAQSGAYLQAVYQFAPRWRAGLRGDWLDVGTARFGVNEPALGGATHAPQRQSVLLEFNPTETSRLRLQLAQDHSRLGRADRQVLLHYQISLGAHPAHAY